MVSEYDEDREAVINRALEAGVSSIVAIGMNVETSLAAIALAEKYNNIYATVGIHPGEVSDAKDADFEEISRIADHPRVVGIGETGLDFHWDTSAVDTQIDFFRQHIRLARSTDLPVVVHDRDAHDAVLSVLNEEDASAGVVLHCFSGDEVMATVAARAGYYLGFGGIVTFKNVSLGNVINAIPSDQLLIETDSPYLSPHPFRGRRNEPARVVHTAETVARLLNITFEELAQITTQNARTVFNLPA
ncbi:MAG: TatD family hydrolase [Candidatus Latescibacteria bacterium]|nr:TatD family hydrolase [Candidatus Latescibacterota bacterium]